MGPQTSSIVEDLRLVEPGRLRRLVRTGAYKGATGGLARGKLQANVVIVPQRFAADFHKFCLANPKACPLVGLGRAGSPFVPALGNIDIRTDASQYSIYCYGEFVHRTSHIVDLWRQDFSAFALGSSLSFEPALMEKGVGLHGRVSGTVPKYRTQIRSRAFGPFGGNLVVAMRAIKRCDVDKVRAITARFPNAHGSPFHVGDPSIIGIADLGRPDWGEAVDVGEGEVPVFWASSVTAQEALVHAELAIAITASPGHLLITDVDAMVCEGIARVA
ncbi:DUF1445 domain-containing protein [Mesorhizobium sp. 1M-11]|uniref:D-glutamate cyclase family protein n=1 Tax=Mesorhizobium sp. 1M-11 TaxID=1529006 RepID=UPI0006C77294|nr:DUF1445 domain-containing protein [Mesorhizobium sp. 1M-11]